MFEDHSLCEKIHSQYVTGSDRPEKSHTPVIRNILIMNSFGVTEGIAKSLRLYFGHICFENENYVRPVTKDDIFHLRYADESSRPVQ